MTSSSTCNTPGSATAPRVHTSVGERIGGDTPYRPRRPHAIPHRTGLSKRRHHRNTSGKKRPEPQTRRHRLLRRPAKSAACSFPVGGHISPSVTPAEQIYKLPAKPCAPSLQRHAPGTSRLQRRHPAPTIEAGPIRPPSSATGLVGQWTAQTLAYRQAKVIMIGMGPFPAQPSTERSSTAPNHRHPNHRLDPSRSGKSPPRASPSPPTSLAHAT